MRDSQRERPDDLPRPSLWERLRGSTRRHPRRSRNRYVARPVERFSETRDPRDLQRGGRRTVYGAHPRREPETLGYLVGFAVIALGLVGFFYMGVQWATGQGPLIGLGSSGEARVLPSPSPLALPSPSPSPSPVEQRLYVVEEGDNPAEIARQFRVSPEALMALNNIDDPRSLRPGQTLKIPPPGTR